MPKHHRRHGYAKAIKYPTNGPAEYMAAWTACTSIFQQLQDEQTHLDQLLRDKVNAERADRQALADAIRAGKQQPTDKAVKAVEAKVEQCRRQVEGLEVAYDAAVADVDAAVAAMRDEWVATLDAQMMDTRTRVSEACDEIEAALTAMQSARTESYWVLNYEPGRAMKPAQARTPYLAAPHGDTYSVVQVLTAIRQLVDQPAPQRLPAPTPPRPRPALVEADGSVNTSHGDYVDHSRHLPITRP